MKILTLFLCVVGMIANSNWANGANGANANPFEFRLFENFLLTKKLFLVEQKFVEQGTRVLETYCCHDRP